MALHMPQSVNPTYWLTEPAPEPHDVHWPFFSASFMQKWLSKIVIAFACLILTTLFLVPVVLVQGLTNLSALEYFFPFLTLILSMYVNVLPFSFTFKKQYSNAHCAKRYAGRL